MAIMEVLRPVVHWLTWGRMYTKNASDDHRPTSIIFGVLTLDRNRDIAAPDLRECDPTSLAWYPRGGVMRLQVVRKVVLVAFCVKYIFLCLYIAFDS